MDKRISLDIRWYNRLQVRVLGIFLVLFLLIIFLIIFIANTIGSSLVERQAYLKLADAGHRVVAELENRTVETVSLAESMAKVAVELPQQSPAFSRLLQQILNHEGTEHLIAGGGVWPEPYEFREERKRDSYFWGRNRDGQLEFFDDYNKPEGPGYHHEEWYVPVKYLQNGQVYWSKSYTDPYSLQPMVTASVPMKRDQQTIGAATIDLKLEGLQELLQSAAKEFGGYAFVIDRNGRFLSFPDDNLARQKEHSITDGSLNPFLNISELAQKQAEFQPLATLLAASEGLIKLSPEQSKGHKELARALNKESYQIGAAEAELIAAALLETGGSTSHLHLNEQHTVITEDYFLKEAAYVSITTMPNTFWRVVTVMPHSVAHKEAGAVFRIFLLVTVAFLLAAVLLVWMLLRYNLTQPLRQLVSQLIRNIEAGSDSTRLIESTNKGELGALAHWFNRRTEQLLESQQKIETLAFYDALTGLPNRRLLLDRLREKRADAKRRGVKGAALFLDLDHFKTLNDSLGHSVGDELLIQVGKRLIGCLRENDTVARIGGDEFVVLLLDDKPSRTASSLQASIVAEKIIAALASPFELIGNSYDVTASIGISLFPASGQSVEDILKEADAAMYEAKSAGRNNFCFFQPSMQRQANERLRVQGELKKAIEQGELFIQYQPQVDMRGACCSVEALVRWQHPVDGLVSPGDFIPIAEESALILSLGNWIFKEVCQQIREWNSQDMRFHHVAVNVSPRQFEQQNFVSDVKAMLEEFDVAPSQIMLEITEGVILDHAKDAINKMAELREMGVAISLDDFGTGYSSLTYLKQLPLDELKIDQSFIRDMKTDSDDVVIIETIISLAHQFGYQVIAEGVETKEQQQILLSKGCSYFQGYFFSRPLFVEELAGYLSEADVAVRN